MMGWMGGVVQLSPLSPSPWARKCSSNPRPSHFVQAQQLDVEHERLVDHALVLQHEGQGALALRSEECGWRGV